MKSQIFHDVYMMQYFWWGCRGNLKLITLGSERDVNPVFVLLTGSPIVGQMFFRATLFTSYYQVNNAIRLWSDTTFLFKLLTIHFISFQGTCSLYDLLLSSKGHAGGGVWGAWAPSFLGNLVHTFDFLYEHTIREDETLEKRDIFKIPNAFTAPKFHKFCRGACPWDPLSLQLLTHSWLAPHFRTCSAAPVQTFFLSHEH